MRKQKLSIYYKSDGLCAVCHKKLNIEEATIDHIKPKAKGGSNKEENLRIVCLECNGRKGSRTGEEKICMIKNIINGLKRIGDKKHVVLDSFRLGEITKEEIITAINDTKSNLVEYMASVFNELDSIIDDLEIDDSKSEVAKIE
jgi:hypothetical protein